MRKNLKTKLKENAAPLVLGAGAVTMLGVTAYKGFCDRKGIPFGHGVIESAAESLRYNLDMVGAAAGTFTGGFCSLAVNGHLPTAITSGLIGGGLVVGAIEGSRLLAYGAGVLAADIV